MAYIKERSTSFSGSSIEMVERRPRLHNFRLPDDGYNWGATRRCSKSDSDSEDFYLHPSLYAPFTDHSREVENELTYVAKNQESVRNSSHRENSMMDLGRGVEGISVSMVEDKGKGKEKVVEGPFVQNRSFDLEDWNLSARRSAYKEPRWNTGEDMTGILMSLSMVQDKGKGKEKVLDECVEGKGKGKVLDKCVENKSGELSEWNLSTKRSSFKEPELDAGDNVMVDVRTVPVGGSGSGVGKADAFARLRRIDGRCRGGRGMGSGVDKKPQRPMFQFELTRDEIEDDFFLMTGKKPPRKTMRRPKKIQRKLNDLVPGLLLTEVTPDSYKVDENQGRKRWI